MRESDGACASTFPRVETWLAYIWYHYTMNKFYLVIRIVLLIALLFLLASVFWGLANRESTEASDGTQTYEQYRGSKPAGYTSILLITLVVLGILIVIVSIVFEYHQVRRENREVEVSVVEREKEEPPAWK
jgi:ABC-type Fe3+ transport system permease subunit